MTLVASPLLSTPLSKPRIAVIGAGHLGTIHARLWLQDTDAVLTTIYDTHPERAQNLVSILQSQFPKTTVHAAQSLEEALENCDAATIATPTSSHFAVAQAALKARKHCFIEKPVAGSLAETEALVELAAQSSALIHVGQVERFNPAFTQITPHNIPPIRYIEAHRLAPFKPRALDVSVILDLMIHDIDLALWLTASPVKEIYANGASMLTRHADMAVARLHFENGAVAQFHVSRLSAETRRTMALYTNAHHVMIDFAAPSLDIFHFSEKGIQPVSFFEKHENPHDTTNFQSATTLQPAMVLQPATVLGEMTAIQTSSAWHEKPPLQATNAIRQEQQAFIAEIHSPSVIVQRATHLSEALESMRIAEAIAAQIRL